MLHNWHFLYRGEGEPPGLTSELAKAYGVQFRDTGEGVQVHGVVTHVIDPEGQMRARFHGLCMGALKRCYRASNAWGAMRAANRPL